ncbi:MAG: hypothetical protein NZ777_09065, partial [Pseudomonadales bacterium]|nr:hypothetical protein [Pseudomonadales bacterium]
MSLCTQILKQIESATLPACVCPTASDLYCDIALLFLFGNPADLVLVSGISWFIGTTFSEHICIAGF